MGTESIRFIYRQEKISNATKDYQYYFTNLFNNCRGELLNTAFKITKSKPLAEDIVHDVFLKFWLKRTEIHELKQPLAYLHVMTRNLTLDNLKKNKYENKAKKDLFFNLVYKESIEEKLTENQYICLVRESLLLMPAKQQQVYRLVKEQGLSHEKAAQELALSPLTVKKHISNALKFIRSYLQKNEVI